MPPCPACQQPGSKRNGRDRCGRQKYACRACRRTFTENTMSAFSGYRWQRGVIVMAVRWYLAYPLSSRQVLELLAERGGRPGAGHLVGGPAPHSHVREVVVAIHALWHGLRRQP